MSSCAWCKNKPCSDIEGQYPLNCPTNNQDWVQRFKTEYQKDENKKIAATAAYIEKTGYCEWTRIEEIMQFARKLDFTKLGLAFCSGLQKEAKVVADYYRNQGFEVISAVCCTGALDKSSAGIREEDKFRPNQPESMCNPIGQALIMNEQQTQLNIVLGLCVGHDSLFLKYSKALVTVLAVKDRVLAHNPLAAVYCADSYYRRKLFPK